jgi:hypothetical protein
MKNAPYGWDFYVARRSPNKKGGFKRPQFLKKERAVRKNALSFFFCNIDFSLSSIYLCDSINNKIRIICYT